ncbi:MAG: sel1 repeat family protein [Gammaproteobacteria bacterium]|nr:sel1 repeat family protein [Gammaproteobacteria bacterium]
MRTFSRILLAASLLMFASMGFAGDFQKGWNAYNSADYETALAEWEALADSGDVDAAYGMGLLYGNGFGVDMNDELALKYYGLAAEKGHADAQFNLAVMHQNGWGVPQSDETANKWYALAAEQGVTAAQIAIGRFYGLDFLDSYDPVEAYKWFSIAEKLGDVDATDKRDFISTRMTPEQLAEADGRVSKWVDSHQSLFAGN